MATEKAARMQQAATLQEIIDRLDRIEAILSGLVKPPPAGAVPPESVATESIRQPGVVTRQGRK